MSKLKALALSIIFAIATVAWYLNHHATLALITFGATIVCTIIWFTKYSRDERILNNANRDRQVTTLRSHQPSQASEESRRLFVPHPLHEK